MKRYQLRNLLSAFSFLWRLAIGATIVAALFMFAQRAHGQAGIVAPVSYPEITGDAATHQLASTGTCRAIQIIAPAGNAAVVRIGDSTTSATKGLPVAAGGGLFMPPLDSDQRESVQQHLYNLSAFYYYAASNDKLDFVCIK